MTAATKLCPFCAEEIKSAAIKCRFCNEMLDAAPARTPVPPVTNHPDTDWHNRSHHISGGTEIREYRIERLIGEGGMGEVYLAEHTYTSQRVAIKAVSPVLMQDQSVRRRFLEEGRVMAGLKHPNIVTLHTFFEEGGRFFLVMELVEGGSLQELLVQTRDRGGRLELEKITHLTEGIAAGLAHAHAQAPVVIHRDIKPANILLDKEGNPVITDFGIAKAVGREKLTRTRGVVGTYEYMSPEQVVGDEAGPESDIYSFGIVLYEMLTGQVPFPQTSPTGIEAMDGHRNQRPSPVLSLRNDCIEPLSGVVIRALAKTPGERFRNGREMQDALKRERVPAPTLPPAPLSPPAPMVSSPVAASQAGTEEPRRLPVLAAQERFRPQRQEEDRQHESAQEKSVEVAARTCQYGGLGSRTKVDTFLAASVFFVGAAVSNSLLLFLNDFGGGVRENHVHLKSAFIAVILSFVVSSLTRSYLWTNLAALAGGVLSFAVFAHAFVVWWGPLFLVGVSSVIIVSLMLFLRLR